MPMAIVNSAARINIQNPIILHKAIISILVMEFAQVTRSRSTELLKLRRQSIEFNVRKVRIAQRRSRRQ